MELTYFITSLGLIPYFTSRIFVPLFTTAMLARIGPVWSLVADLAGVELLSSLPAWTTNNFTLWPRHCRGAGA